MLEVIKKTLALIVILCAFRLGVFTWMAISAFALGPLSVIINAWPNKKLLDYTIWMQLMDVLPTIMVCVAESVAIIGIGFSCNIVKEYLGIGDSGATLITFLSCKLLLQFTLGAIVFFGLSYFFRLKPMGEYVRMGVAAMKTRMPRLSDILERRFLA